LVSFLEAVANNPAQSAIDRYNLQQLLAANSEWAKDAAQSSLQTLSIKQPDFLYLNRKNFFLALNPILSAQGMYETDNNNRSPLWSSSQGVELRAQAANRIGLSLAVSNNIETLPAYVQDWAQAQQAIPGAGPYRYAGNGQYNYLLVRGHADFSLIKNYIHVSAGYDKQFIGDGYRTLFLSDFSAGAAFAGIRTRIWKLHYQNLYLELMPQFHDQSPAGTPHKYAAIHHLSVNATRWLNIGLFEATTFARKDHYDFAYLNPIILYRATERYLGSPDKVALGINFKALALKKFNLYGQFLLNEFTAKEFFGNKGYWANKWGLQLGVKYYDVAGIRNLDLQLEANFIRPFTYSHSDTMSNFTHYNQPLAHPLGAGVREFIGIVRYQPARKWFVTGKAIYYNHGNDSTGNDGGNIFLSYDTRSHQYGYGLIGGIEATGLYLNLHVSYELKPHLFIDLGAQHHQLSYAGDFLPKNTSNALYLGFRLNVARREYDFR
jgi:hypothetical protein